MEQVKVREVWVLIVMAEDLATGEVEAHLEVATGLEVRVECLVALMAAWLVQHVVEASTVVRE